MTSPVQFAGSYKSLMVRLGSTKPPVIVSVADYQNPGPNWVVKYDAMVNGAVNDGGSHGKRWQAAQGVYQQHVKKEGHVIFGEPFPQGFGPLAIQLLHKGGGSPAHIASVLQLAARYPKDMDLDPTAPLFTSLQGYVDKWIGVYCTGLVGSYTEWEMGCIGRSSSTYIPLFAPLTYRRKAIDDVQPLDVIVYTNGGHIAIIDSLSGGGATRRARVVESSSDGKYQGVTNGPDNVYELLSVSKGRVFKVKRGLPCSTPVPEVYIADPKSMVI